MNALSNLQEYLRKRIEVTDVASDLADDISGEISGRIEKTQSPEGWKSGTMDFLATVIDGPFATRGGVVVRIGRLQKAGKAPSGTITQFLNDFPEYSFDGKKPSGRVGTRKSYFRGAWLSLPPEGRDVLARERSEGRYGGVVGEARYTEMQESSRNFIADSVTGLDGLIEKALSKKYA